MASESVCGRAVEAFGVTEDIRKAGFILPDGRLLDFSRGNERAVVEHNKISNLYHARNRTDEDMFKRMYRFMGECGAVRITLYDVPFHKQIAINLVRKPTSKQIQRIEKSLSRGVDVITLERGEPSSEGYCYLTERNPSLLIMNKFLSKCLK